MKDKYNRILFNWNKFNIFFDNIVIISCLIIRKSGKGLFIIRNDFSYNLLVKYLKIFNGKFGLCKSLFFHVLGSKKIISELKIVIESIESFSAQKKRTCLQNFESKCKC